MENSLERWRRKEIVFHIMYGYFPSASEEEMTEWRQLCAKYIDDGGDYPPLSLAGFRKIRSENMDIT